MADEAVAATKGTVRKAFGLATTIGKSMAVSFTAATIIAGTAGGGIAALGALGATSGPLDLAWKIYQEAGSEALAWGKEIFTAAPNMIPT